MASKKDLFDQIAEPIVKVHETVWAPVRIPCTKLSEKISEKLGLNSEK